MESIVADATPDDFDCASMTTSGNKRALNIACRIAGDDRGGLVSVGVCGMAPHVAARFCKVLQQNCLDMISLADAHEALHQLDDPGERLAELRPSAHYREFRQ